MFMRISYVLTVIVGVLSFQSQAQIRPERTKYIETYSHLAVQEMKKSGIPASITMAQALLESNDGQSELALTANNHFGIKCHTTWTGRRFYYDDDNLNDCFRAYKKVEESYQDHSLFLMTRERYASLFELDPSDYKAWAIGLKAAGYATNPNYANLLIKIIEDNKLYQLDNWISSASSRSSLAKTDLPGKKLPDRIEEMPIHTRNRIKFLIADSNDKIEDLTRELNLFKWELRKYNEIPKRGELVEGQIVYLQPKRKKAAHGYDIHYVQPGETWYSIAQLYGIKLKWLYRRNDAQPGTPVEPGMELFLRGNRPSEKPL